MGKDITFSLVVETPNGIKIVDYRFFGVKGNRLDYETARKVKYADYVEYLDMKRRFGYLGKKIGYDLIRGEKYKVVGFSMSIFSKEETKRLIKKYDERYDLNKEEELTSLIEYEDFLEAENELSCIIKLHHTVEQEDILIKYDDKRKRLKLKVRGEKKKYDLEEELKKDLPVLVNDENTYNNSFLEVKFRKL
jgi:hypothetical protein